MVEKKKTKTKAKAKTKAKTKTEWGWGLGRPSKYKPEYDQALIEHMKQGLSFECFGAAIGVGRSSTWRWLETETSFREAKREAEQHCRLFWEKVGIGGVTGKIGGFNASAWIFNMKNRFRWRDRVESTGEVKIAPYVIEKRDGSQVELGVNVDEETDD